MLKIDILGVEVSAIDPDRALDHLATFVSSGSRKYVCVSGVHGIIESQGDPDLMRIHNSAAMVTPDGAPLVWCGRYAGAPDMRRVYGPDLMLRVMAESCARGWKHFLYGAAPGVAEELGLSMEERYPGVEIVGTFSPPYRDLEPAEIHEIATMINDAEPDFVWVGLSTPKQERWMDRFRPLLTASVLVGVGAAFDMHTGRIPQAPGWMQRAGLEWLFRLAVEPRRLWRRYFKIIPHFLVRIVVDRPRLVHSDEESSTH